MSDENSRAKVQNVPVDSWDLLTGARLTWWERALGILPLGIEAGWIGREMLGLFRLLNERELATLGRVIGQDVRPLERSLSEVAVLLHNSPQLVDVMKGLRSRGMDALSSALQKHRIGDVFELRAAIQELMNGGRGLRIIQDVIADAKGVLRMAADLITETGDVIQLKNYGGRFWEYSLARAIRKQAQSDFFRYGANGWVDRTGRALSGTFEFQFNARRLLAQGVPRDVINAFATKMTAALRARWAEYGLTHIVIPSF